MTGWGSPRSEALVPGLAGFVGGALQMSGRSSGITPRRSITIDGEGGFALSGSGVKLCLTVTDASSAEVLITVRKPLKVRGKSFAGAGVATIRRDDGTTRRYPLRIEGTVTMDSKGAHHASGVLWAAGRKNRPLLRDGLPVLRAEFA